jgi:uncharacterized phage-associated protein
VVIQAPYDVRLVANNLLDKLELRSIYITQMELYKHLFFAHGWYLVVNDRPLIEDKFEAWEFGPVQPLLRSQLKNVADKKIDIRFSIIDIFAGHKYIPHGDMKEEDVSFLVSIYDSYSKYSAYRLSDETHVRGGPWDIVWNHSDGLANPGLKIRDSEIKDFFASVRGDSFHA